MACEGDYVKWIYSAFGECIVSTREKAGFALGLSSTIIWMYAQIPQIVMNFKNKSTEGLSFAFLCLLVTGDLCNLLGALINHGLVTQIITAIWFLIVDGFCVSQYIYYVWIRPRFVKKSRITEYDYMNPKNKNNANDHGDGVNFSVNDTDFRALPSIPLLLASASATVYPNPYLPPQLYGTLLGWCSAVAYISSRTPQIVKNFRRRRTEGVSCQFFISAVLGNTTYAASIFLKDSHWAYIWGQFPWLLGSAGILFFDFTVLGQFLVFGSTPEDHDISTITDIPSHSLDYK